MKWIINDCSLDAQHESADTFISELHELLRLRGKYHHLKANFHCSRVLGDALVTPTLQFSKLIMQSPDKNLKAQVLSWITKKGPFWDDQRTDHDVDYFELEGVDVTDSGLGECARVIAKSGEATAYSFSGRYEKTPLLVDHGLPEERYGQFPVHNLWSHVQLEQHVQQSTPTPETWEEALELLQGRFSSLVFADNLLEYLAPQPFSLTVHYRLIELCTVLQEFLDSRDNGINTARSNEIIANHFSGEKAWFTDESQQNKNKFEKELTFQNTLSNEKHLFPFHGKIKTPQFRMHFDWPIPAEQLCIYVAYIGPKITKS